MRQKTDGGKSNFKVHYKAAAVLFLLSLSPHVNRAHICVFLSQALICQTCVREHDIRMHPQIHTQSDIKAINAAEICLIKGWTHRRRRRRRRVRWKRHRKKERRKVCVPGLLLFLNMCVSVFMGDLTPGSTIVFSCDGRPLTQRRPTLQSLPTVQLWKAKLSFVCPW